MCDVHDSGAVKDSSGGGFLLHYFKSSFAKSVFEEMTVKPAMNYGTSEIVNNMPSVSCPSNSVYQEVAHFSMENSASYRSLDRNFIMRYSDSKRNHHLNDRAANFEEAGPWSREHRPIEEERPRHHLREFKLAMGDDSPPDASPMLHVDAAILHSRINTLQWQLKQSEEGRQMYHSIMEHVVKFLEHVYTSLDELSRTQQCKSLPASVCNSPNHRVPRSMSALSVDASHSRSATRGKRETGPNVSRAESTALIEESPSIYCDYTLRRSSKVTQHCDATAQKLSQEAYRLLRTVQSLLNTNEPNLVQNMELGGPCHENQLAPSRSDKESFSRLSPDAVPLQQSLQDLSVSKSSSHNSPAENTPKRNWKVRVTDVVGSYSSLRRERSRQHEPLNSTPKLPRDSCHDSSSTDGHLLVPHFTASLGRPKKLKESKMRVPSSECLISGPPSEKQLSLSSNEDESGFSSMSSFQEVGLPLVPSSSNPSADDVPPSYPEIGVPVFEAGDCAANHRRWNSVPVDTHMHSQKMRAVIPDTVSVMWV